MSISSAIARAMGRGQLLNKANTDNDDEVLEEDEKTDMAEDEDEKASSSDEDDTNVETDDDDTSGESDQDTKKASARDRKMIAHGADRERKRIAAILTHQNAEAQPDLAAHLAFNTDTPAKAACATLATAKGSVQPSSAAAFVAQMQSEPAPTIGGGGKATMTSFADRKASARADYLASLNPEK